MTYIPLHHKYRPQTFSELVGQEAIATTLSNALQQNRIAPAYLFTGARGTGKTSSARIFAKSLNCIAVNAPTDRPCGVCQTCQEITKGSALDVIEIDAASNTGVDNIRELIERAQFAPVQCRYKTYVIDEVHMLSNASFNALLKTLEEPPEQVVFILATTDPQRVLPTIISRCQRFDFRRIPIDSMTQHLTAIAQQEQIAIAADAIYLIAQISQGGLRDAESLLDQLSLLAGNITVERVWDLVGAVPERDLMALLEAIAQNHPESVLDITRRLMDRGREPLIVLQNLASFYRDLLIAKTAPERGDLVALTAPTWAQLCEFAKAMAIEAILAGQQRLKESEAQLRNTTQPRLWLEVTLLGLLPCAITAAVSNSTPPISTSVKPAVAQPTATPVEVKGISSVQAVVSQPVATSDQADHPHAVSEAIPQTVRESEIADASTPLDHLWQTIIQNLQPFGTQALFKQHGSLLAFDGAMAQIGIPEKLLPMAQSRSKSIITALTKTFDKEIKLSLVVAPTVESKPEAPPTPMPRAQVTMSPASKLPKSTGQANVTAPRPEPAPAEFIPTADWDEDEVTRVARRLAEDFNGELVNMAGSEIEPLAETVEQALSADAAPLEELEEDDDDIAF